MPRVAPSSPRVGVVNTKLGQSARLRYAISRAEISELKGGLLNGSLVQIKDVAAKVATEYSEVLKNSWALTEPLFVNEPDKHGSNHQPQSVSMSSLTRLQRDEAGNAKNAQCRLMSRSLRSGPPPFSHLASAGGSPPAPRGGRDVERPRPILQRCKHGHDFEAQDMSAGLAA